MIKIGDFSKLAHVTVKTLRHYGRVGLLKPVWIDRFTSYRYYSLQQLPRLNRILALKDLGFSLEQISAMLDEELPPEQLRHVLYTKQAELEQQLQTGQQRLMQVETRIHQIEQEQKLPLYEAVVKKVAPQTVASTQETVETIDELPARCVQILKELRQWSKQMSCKETGVWMLINHSREYVEQNVKVEVAIAVTDCSAKKLEAFAQRGFMRTLPATNRMASVIHSEDAGTLVQAYTALYAWVDTNGYRASGPVRELHLVEPDIRISSNQDISGRTLSSGRQSGIIEVQMPVEPISFPRPKIISNQSGTEKENDMEPKLVTKPAFMVVGMKYVGKNQNQEISQLWKEFNPLWNKIQYKVPNGIVYGICEDGKDGEFEYVAGVEVSKVEQLPKELVVRFVPESKYAVFTHQGPLAKLKGTYNYAYQEWLPKSGYQLTGGYDFELYDEKFDDFSEKSIFYIYVPIK